MDVRELNREQLIQLKQRYLAELDDNGVLNAVLYNEPKWDEDNDHHLSTGELAVADGLVSDDFIFDHYAGVVFVEDDFN